MEASPEELIDTLVAQVINTVDVNASPYALSPGYGNQSHLQSFGGSSLYLNDFIHHPDLCVGITVDVLPPAAIRPDFRALFLALFRVNFSSPTIFELSYASEGEVAILHLAPVPIAEPCEDSYTLSLGLRCGLLALRAKRNNVVLFIEIIIGLPRYQR